MGKLHRLSIPTHFVPNLHNGTLLQERNIFASKHLGSKRPANLVNLIGSTGDPMPPGDRWQTPSCLPRSMKRFFLIPLRLLVSPRLLLAFIAFCFVFSVASQAQTQIVAFGASNVAGYGVWPSQAWPAQLEIMLKSKGYNVQIKNAGKSVDTTSGMLHRLNLAVPYGTNSVILDM